jgi:5-methyltetrahydrofolate--homocysteine methyltransferase
MVTSLAYKEDWRETRERLLGWWNHEYLNRCALAVTAPKKNPPDIPKPPDAQTPEQRWFDLDWISLHMEYNLSRTYFGGEAIPVWNAGYAGVSAIPALLGCPTDIDMETGWWRPILTDPDRIDFSDLELDENHDLYRFTLKMLERACTESRGRALPSIGAFGGCGDTLAALRGTQQLLIDCIERPEEVHAAEEFLMDMWCDFYDQCYSIIHEAAEGSTCWFTLWSPGKFYPAHNDFSYNIGPSMFREIFLPIIRRQTEFLDHTVYHVDGVNAFQHVDALCELPNLQAIQILPGAGQPSPMNWIETLKKVQAAGKNLHISIPADEVERALTELSARGLFIDTSTETEDEARDLLGRAERLSVDR